MLANLSQIQYRKSKIVQCHAHRYQKSIANAIANAFFDRLPAGVGGEGLGSQDENEASRQER